jgi:DNA-binding NarL/FixJ family response regulator
LPRQNLGPRPDLTPRELEVVRLIALGDSNETICKELCIEASTLKKHISNIASKLGTKNRVQLVLKYWGIGG